MSQSLPSGDCSSLIVLTGSLGDVARGLPLAALLKQARPSGRVTWVVERRWSPLVSLSPHVSRVVEFDRAAGPRAIPPLVRALREERYDIAFDLQRLFKSGLIARWSGARRRVGFHPRDSRELNRFFNNECIAAHGMAVSKLRHYLAFGEHVGLDVPASPDFGLSGFDVAAHLPASLARRARPYVVVAVGSSWPSKNWPAIEAEHLCELILAETALDIVLAGHRPPTGGGNGAERPTPVHGGGRVIDLRGRTSLVELTAVLAGGRLAIGPDTGTGHVAAAVGTRYLGLFGPTDSRRVAPWGSEALAVTSPATCVGCRRRRCTGTSDWCMASITADLVWQRASDALAAADGRSTA